MATTASINAYLVTLYAAREAVTNNKSYTSGSMTYTRQDLATIEDLISKYEGRLSLRTRGSRLDVEIVR